MTTESIGEVVERFEFALLARLHQFNVTDEALLQMMDLDAIRELKGLGPDDKIEMIHVEPREIDTDEVHDIAQYLIDIEELGDDFDNPDEREHVVSIGMFIHGFIHRFHDG